MKTNMQTRKRISDSMAAREEGSRRGRRWAFTLMELMVVVLIVSVLLGIAVPSFSSMLRSSESSMAETLLRNALRSGRDAALRSGAGKDAAVVFFYTPGGKMSMVTCVKVGEFLDKLPPPASPPYVMRDIFVPAENMVPSQLPKNWMVRGYAPTNSIDVSWYEPVGGGAGRYGLIPDRGDWVFPETNFFNPAVADDGGNRQTFMIRFEAGTGLVSASNGNAALVFYPGIDRQVRNTPLWSRYEKDRGNYRRYVERALIDNSIQTDAERRSLIGNICGDTLLVKPVKALAMGDERKLAAALGVRVDPTTGCLYAAGTMPQFLTGVTSEKIGQWIEGNGDLNGNGIVDSREDTYIRDPKVFLVDRFTSELREVEVQP